MKVLSTLINPQQSPLFYELTNGIETDKLFFKEEFTVQLAWAEELHLSNYLSKSEWAEISENLEKLKASIISAEYLWSVDDEDIHMAIEKEVTKASAELGKKMHLGRSRNDLVATSLKLYTAHFYTALGQEVSRLIEALLFLAHRDQDSIVPSFTHSQSAQPIRMGHLWNFHAINFLTDLDQIRFMQKSCLQTMPLGSSAIAGTHLQLDLQRMATKLGFTTPPMNSIHGVSDRDYLIDLSFTVSRISLHIARLCEDIIHYSSTHLGIVTLPHSWSSGSSAMPNKKNPDFFEVLRAKSKNLMSLVATSLNISSSLGSGYSSDFHELKKIVLRDGNSIKQILSCLASACRDLQLNSENCEKALGHGHILATDIANHFVSEGMAFRDAYNKVAALISMNEVNCRQVGIENLTYVSSVESKNVFGGTSKKQILQTSAWINEKLCTLKASIPKV
jgi:argininosuccinate lyase